MSSEALPITPARFAAALPSLPLSTLALKAAELRNSVAHLDYSNEQLKPFAEPPNPDPDCADAIKENEGVIKSILERLDILKAEVEKRGVSWREFAGSNEAPEGPAEERLVNGAAEHEGGSNPWTDGTFQTGRIVNGEVRMDGGSGQAEVTNGTSASDTATTTGGRLDDDQLRAALAERMRESGLNDDNAHEGGMHL